jgi:hypothetical protein
VNDTLPYALTQIANWKNDNSFNEEAHTLLRQVHFRKIFFERNVRGKCSRKASKKKNEVQFFELQKGGIFSLRALELSFSKILRT